MYCMHCGSENVDQAKFCKNCGKRLDGKDEEEQSTPNSSEQHVVYCYREEEKNYNVTSIIGCVISCVSLVINFFGLVGFVGLILSIVGYQETKIKNEKGQIVAAVGIIIGAVSSLIMLITAFACANYTGRR